MSELSLPIDEHTRGLGNLVDPAYLYSATEVLPCPSPVPGSPGVYAWYFTAVPPGVPTEGCVQYGRRTLLYVGIAPKAPPNNGRRASTQTLWGRIRYHYRGNAEGSTLRLTLGCLLAEELDIGLRRVGSGKRMTFTADGESKLSAWMAANAFVCWIVDEKPWEREHLAINTLSLPLNLQGNRSHAHHPALTALRARAKERAAALPIVAR